MKVTLITSLVMPHFRGITQKHYNWKFKLQKL